MLVEEKEFFDFKTAPVQGTNVIDLHRTGMSYYDDFLSEDTKLQAYLKDQKNLIGHVEYMSPKEYFQGCSDYGFPNSHPSVQQLIADRQRDVKTLEHLKNVLLIHKHRFPMPVLNKAANAQEGLHRMLVVADLFGWDHKVPVLVVDWADPQRAFELQKQQRKRRIEEGIRKAVLQTLRYNFKDLEELKTQLQWELDKVFDYDEDVDTPVAFELILQDNIFNVVIGSASYDFDYNDVNFIDTADNEDILDDLDLEDPEDFLQRYFGDDWRKTHPHLKDVFKLKEAIQPTDLVQMNNIIVETFGSTTPGEGCIFIATDGSFINIYPRLDDHEDLCYWLEEQGYGQNPEDASWFVSEFNYVRCRNSRHLCFLELPRACTTQQYHSIEEWLEEKVTSETIQVITPDGSWKEYSTNEYFPEEIIRLIRRYYTCGQLYEKLI